MSGPYQDVKRELEQVFCNLLKEKIGVEFKPYKADEELDTPYGVVACSSCRPIAGGASPRGWRAEVKVAYVSHIDEVNSGVHSQKVAEIEDAISLVPQAAVEDYQLQENHIKVAGLFIKEHRDQSESQSFGDVFDVDVGVNECRG